MKRVQADQRIVGCAEKLVLDRQAVFVDQLMPLPAGADT